MGVELQSALYLSYLDFYCCSLFDFCAIYFTTKTLYTTVHLFIRII